MGGSIAKEWGVDESLCCGAESQKDEDKAREKPVHFQGSKRVLNHLGQSAPNVLSLERQHHQPHHHNHSDHTNGAPAILETADRWTASSGDLVSIMKQEMWKERNASTGSMSSLGGDHQHHHHHHHHHRQHHNSSVATGVGRPRHGDLA